MSGLFLQRFDATGTLGTTLRPSVSPISEALAADSDGGNVVVLHSGSSGVRLSAIGTLGAAIWTTPLRASGFVGTVGVLGSEIWTSFTDGTALRVRAIDGRPFGESYPYNCEAFVQGLPTSALRGFCVASPNLVPISRCP